MNPEKPIEIKDERNAQFVMVFYGELEKIEKDSRALTLWAVLLTYANKDRECFPSQETLSGRMGVSIATVVRAIRALKESGLLKVIVRSEKGQSNLYRLVGVTGDTPMDGGPSPMIAPPIMGDGRGAVTGDLLTRSNGTRSNNHNGSSIALQALDPAVASEVEAVNVALSKCQRFRLNAGLLGSLVQTWRNVAPDVDHVRLILALDAWAVGKGITRSEKGWARTFLSSAKGDQDKIGGRPGAGRAVMDRKYGALAEWSPEQKA